jgi:hypothetical protein
MNERIVSNLDITPNEPSPRLGNRSMPHWLLFALLVVVALMVIPAWASSPTAASRAMVAPTGSGLAAHGGGISLLAPAHAGAGSPVFRGIPTAYQPAHWSGSARPVSGDSNSNSTASNSFIMANSASVSAPVTLSGNAQDLVSAVQDWGDFQNGSSNSAYGPSLLMSGLFWTHGVTASAHSSDGGKDWSLSFPGANSSWTLTGSNTLGSVHWGPSVAASDSGNDVLIADNYAQPCQVFLLSLPMPVPTTNPCNSTAGFSSPSGIAVSRSTDGGTSFSHVAMVSSDEEAALLSINLPCLTTTYYFPGNFSASLPPTLSLNPSNGRATVTWLEVSYNYAGQFYCVGTSAYYNNTTPAVFLESSSSSNGGITWSAPINVSDNNSAYASTAIGPSPAYRNYLVYADYANASTAGVIPIDYSLSTDNGSSWSAGAAIPGVGMIPVNGVSTDGYPAANEIQLAVDSSSSSSYDGHLYMVYADNVSYTNPEPSVVFLTSSNGGSSWTSPVFLAEGTTDVSYAEPAISVGPSGVVWVTFYAINANSGGILFEGVASFNGGQSWTGIFPVSDTAGTTYVTNAYANFGSLSGIVGTSSGAVATWTDCRPAATCQTQTFLDNYWAMSAGLSPVSLDANIAGVTATVVVGGSQSSLPLNATAVWENGTSVAIQVPTYEPDPSNSRMVYGFTSWSGISNSTSALLSMTYTGGAQLEAMYTAQPAAWVAGIVGPSTLPSGVTLTVKVNGAAVPLTSYNSTADQFNLTVPAGQSYTVVVTAGNYYLPYSDQVSTSAYSVSQVNIYLTRTNGWIAGTVTPATATVLVNGTAATVTNGRYNVTVYWGQYAVNGELTGFTNFYDNISVTPGRTMTVNVLVVGGTIQGTISPPTAVVKVDGVVQSVVAGEFSTAPLPGGTHLVTATIANYSLYSWNVLVNPGHTTSIQIVLVQSGWVTGTVSPTNASVQIAGKQWSVNPTTGAFNVSLKGNQKYEVESYRAGYTPFFTNVTVSPGNVTPVSIKLNLSSNICTTPGQNGCPCGTVKNAYCNVVNNSNGSSNSNLLLYVAIGVVIALVVVIAVVMLLRRRSGGDATPAEPTSGPTGDSNQEGYSSPPSPPS